MRYSTYIFDLDGTLLNTLCDLAISTNYALQVHGLPQHSEEDIRQFVGNGVVKLMERAIPEGKNNPKFDAILKTFGTHYLQYGTENTAPYPGIIDMLKTLKRTNRQVAIVSNKFDEATKLLSKQYFGNLIDLAIGEQEAKGIRKKPFPDTVEAVLKQLHSEKERAVYIGDSDVDIETARNCKIPCISVTWGFRDRTFLIEHGADTLIDTPKELLQITNV